MGSLSFQEAGLRAFWSVNGPRIIQVGYEDEEDPKVMEAYEQLGSLVCTNFCLPMHTSTQHLSSSTSIPLYPVVWFFLQTNITASAFTVLPVD